MASGKMLVVVVIVVIVVVVVVIVEFMAFFYDDSHFIGIMTDVNLDSTSIAMICVETPTYSLKVTWVRVSENLSIPPLKRPTIEMLQKI